MKTARQKLQEEVDDLRQNVLIQAMHLDSRLDAIRRALANGRIMNRLGEIQGEASKLDATIACYAQAIRSLEIFDEHPL